MEPAPKDEPALPPAAAESPRTGRNLPVAIVTGLSLAGLLFGTLFWRPVAFFVLVATVLLLALQEFYSALAKRGYRPATALGMAGGALVLLALAALIRGSQPRAEAS
jgi:phosphatidate cytidylyltransferase